MRARGASLRQLAAAVLRGSPGGSACRRGGAVLAVAVTPGGGCPLAWWLGAAALLVAPGPGLDRGPPQPLLT